MKKGSKRAAAKKSTATELDTTDTDAVVEAQQKSMAANVGTGYVGTMSAEALADEADRLEKIVNTDNDAPQTGVSPAFLSRHPDAIAEDEQGDEVEEGAALGQPGSRVGFASVEHPRARMASSLHDILKGRKPSAFTADELSDHAEKVGLNVDGSGDDGAVKKADFVRAMDSLIAQHPLAAVSE